MSNVIQFPFRDGIVITEGTDVDTGEQIYLLEYVQSGTRTVVGEYRTLLHVAQATIDWESDGVPLIDPPRGAA